VQDDLDTYVHTILLAIQVGGTAFLPLVSCCVFLLVVERVEAEPRSRFACLLIHEATGIEDREIGALVDLVADTKVVLYAGALSRGDGARDGEVDVLVRSRFLSDWSHCLVEERPDGKRTGNCSSGSFFSEGVAGSSSSSSQDRSGPRFPPILLPPRDMMKALMRRGN